MRRLVWIFAAALPGAVQAQMLPETEAFLAGIGIDPQSPTVAAVAYDRVDGVSLGSLAAAGDEEGVRTFLATRKFLFDLRVLPGARRAAPDARVFDPDRFMTPKEQAEAQRLFFDAPLP